MENHSGILKMIYKAKKTQGGKSKAYYQVEDGMQEDSHSSILEKAKL